MTKIVLPMLLVVLGSLAGGCSSQTPEEKEAAKYPQTPPLTPEEQAKANELAGIPADKRGSP